MSKSVQSFNKSTIFGWSYFENIGNEIKMVYQLIQSSGLFYRKALCIVPKTLYIVPILSLLF